MSLKKCQLVSMYVSSPAKPRRNLAASQRKIKKCIAQALPNIYSQAYENSIIRGMMNARAEWNPEFIAAVISIVGLPEDLRARGIQKLGEMEHLSRQTPLVQSALERLGITEFPLDNANEAIMEELGTREGIYNAILKIHSGTSVMCKIKDKELYLGDVVSKLQCIFAVRREGLK